MKQFKSISVVYVYVSDLERAKKFYNDTLGWPEVYTDDALGWVEWGEEGKTHLAINRWSEPGELPRAGPIPVLVVEDPHKTTADLRARGVRCDDVVEIPNVISYGTFYDPDGNRLQFARDNTA
jgi:catechol-2,3-dioxygenase